MTTTTKNLIDLLHDVGLRLSVNERGGLLVTPSDRLNDDLRVLIRGNKAALVDWVKTEVEAPLTTEAQLIEYRLYSKLQPPPARPPQVSPPQATESPSNPVDWHALDAAYLAHHFNCPTCIAAGRGTRYGLRCGTGAALWTQYSDTTTPNTPTTKTKGET